MTPTPRDRARAVARREATLVRLSRARRACLVGTAGLTAVFTAVVASATPHRASAQPTTLVASRAGAPTPARTAAVHHAHHARRRHLRPAASPPVAASTTTATVAASAPAAAPAAPVAAPAPAPAAAAAPAPVAAAAPAATSGGS